MISNNMEYKRYIKYIFGLKFHHQKWCKSKVNSGLRLPDPGVCKAGKILYEYFTFIKI